jgi:hypothetical protein
MAADFAPAILGSIPCVPSNELTFNDGALPDAFNHVIDRTVAASPEARPKGVGIRQQCKRFIDKRFEVVTIILTAKQPVVKAAFLGK